MLYDEAGAVRGVATGDMGVGQGRGADRQLSSPASSSSASTRCSPKARAAISARRSSRAIELDDGRDPQTWGIGIKELWEIDAAKHVPGLVVHSAGWPLDRATYGGGFMYHLEDRLVSVGLVVGLGYANP